MGSFTKSHLLMVSFFDQKVKDKISQFKYSLIGMHWHSVGAHGLEPSEHLIEIGPRTENITYIRKTYALL